MAVSLKHKKALAKADGPDSTVVQPSDWNNTHDLTAAAGKVLGTPIGSTTVQELPLEVDATLQSVKVPSGSSASRPATPSAGMARYNSTTARFEYYTDGAWKNIDNMTVATTAPAAPLKGDFWLDTSSGNVLKIYSGTDWVVLIGDGSITLTQLATPVQQSLAPSGSLMAFAGSSAPSGWLLCAGQAVSRTTYAALFAVIGSTYGVGDGSTTFNLPDLRGRTVAGKDDMGGSAASRLNVTQNGTTTAGSAVVTALTSTANLTVGMQVFGSTIPAGATIATIDSATQVTLSTGTGVTAGTASLRFAIVDGATLGAAGGSQHHQLLTSQIPAHQHLVASPGGGTAGTLSGSNYVDYTRDTSSNYSYTLYGSSTPADRGLSSSTGGGQAHPNMQPTIVLNYIIKT